ncbi:MAG TPA: SpoIID/LytB domain-containing protein [Longimicrobium sp.]|nr:SpoIID/LytB domain-containing protein [Longimicrobium sp.]
MPATRSARRWAEAAAALAVAAVLGGCVTRPAPARTPRVPVVTLPPDTTTPPVPPAPPPAAPPPAVEPPPVAPVANAPAVSVGLVVDTSRIAVTSRAGFRVLLPDGTDVGTVQAGDTAVFTESGGTVSLSTHGLPGSAMRIPERIAGHGLQPPITLRPLSALGTVIARGAPYRGELLVQRAPGGGLTLVNRLDMETYLLGVVPRELGRVDETVYQAVKAQAVAARTYAVGYMGRRSAQGFDVYATVEDQVYGGAAAENELVSRAVRETAGEILVHGGRPITAYYHSTCAGQTAAIDEVWNNPPVPYLVSVRDVDPRTGEAYDRSSSRFRWTETWTHADLVNTLNRTLRDSLGGRRITRITDMRVLERTPSGRVRAMRIETDAGSFTVGRDRVRWILVPNRGGILNSSKFDVRLVRSNGRVMEIVAEGGGWGHGIGMCQVGAMGRARAGQDYRTILTTYYQGTVIEKRY